MRYAYYPGCIAQTSGEEVDRSTRLVAQKMGIELLDFPEFSCCGGAVIDEVDEVLNLSLNGRTLALTESRELDLLTVCSTCYGMLTRSNKVFKQNGKSASKASAILAKIGMKYGGGTKVKHLLQIIVEDFGLEKLNKMVVKPLRGLKVAPFYGCHILRPADIVEFDDPWNPHSIEDLIVALGAEPVRYEGRLKCCGFPILFVKERQANHMAGKQLQEAVEEGADVIATPCPLCHFSLDTYQSSAVKEVGKDLKIPVLHLSQLIGLAFDLKKDDLGLSRHMVSTDQLIQRIQA